MNARLKKASRVCEVCPLPVNFFSTVTFDQTNGRAAAVRGVGACGGRCVDLQRSLSLSVSLYLSLYIYI